MKQPGKVVVWPANIDSSKSRKKGRRLKKSIALESPKLSEISESARMLGLNPHVTEKTSRPSDWWEKTGHAIVDKAGHSKSRILTDIANTIRKLRTRSKKS